MQRRFAIVALISVVAIVAAACSSSPSGNNNNTGTGAPNLAQNAMEAGEHDVLTPPGTGAAVTGGTLKIVGSGDVDHLDTCCAYYTTTYELLRAVSRQLVSYQSSYSDPAPTTPVPDMATYTVSSNGLTYTFKIKQGVMWDAPSGARQVSSQDEELGLKRLCNPVSPAPPLAYWENNIVGMKSYCTGFQAIKLPSSQSAEIAALKNYIDNNNISGIQTPDSQTIKITIERPANSFINIMALPMSSPVPVEILNYLPASTSEEESFISDGPYTITKYVPGVSYTLVKNPNWEASTDTLRHQYFDGISITMGLTPTAIQEELSSGQADLEWDTTVPPADVEGLETSHSSGFLAGYIGGITYLVFNMKSTADGGALAKASVRKALQYCVNKDDIVKVSGGPGVNVPSNQVLAPQLVGYTTDNTWKTPNNDSGNQSKCKSMLAAAGYPNGLNLKLVYPNNPPLPNDALKLQSAFAQAGVNITFNVQPTQGGYFTYIETASNQKSWDVAFGLWFPDWLGNGAQSFFSPLLDGRLYTSGSTNYGDYNDPHANALIDTALAAKSISAAQTAWAAADRYVSDDNPAWIPLIYQALPQFIGPNVKNALYNGDLGYVDITDLWKTS